MLKIDQLIHVAQAIIVGLIMVIVPIIFAPLAGATIAGLFREQDQQAWRYARHLDLRSSNGHTALKGLPASYWVKSFNPLAWTKGNQIDFVAFIIGGAVVSIALHLGVI